MCFMVVHVLCVCEEQFYSKVMMSAIVTCYLVLVIQFQLQYDFETEQAFSAFEVFRSF